MRKKYLPFYPWSVTAAIIRFVQGSQKCVNPPPLILNLNYPNQGRDLNYPNHSRVIEGFNLSSS